MTGDDKKAEDLATWLRERGHRCRVLPEEACTNAAVLVEGTGWSFLCVRNSSAGSYYPSCIVDGKTTKLDPVGTRQQVLSLISGE